DQPLFYRENGMGQGSTRLDECRGLLLSRRGVVAPGILRRVLELGEMRTLQNIRLIRRIPAEGISHPVAGCCYPEKRISRCENCCPPLLLLAGVIQSKR